MTQLLDDQLLGRVLRGGDPPLPDRDISTTGYWYVRLCGAVLSASDRAGVLSGPFAALPGDARARAIEGLLALPASIGLLSLRELGPLIGQLRARHDLNILGLEALAAASRLDAEVFLSAPAPRLLDALNAEGLAATVIA